MSSLPAQALAHVPAHQRRQSALLIPASMITREVKAREEIQVLARRTSRYLRGVTNKDILELVDVGMEPRQRFAQDCRTRFTGRLAARRRGIEQACPSRQCGLTVGAYGGGVLPDGRRRRPWLRPGSRRIDSGIKVAQNLQQPGK